MPKILLTETFKDKVLGEVSILDNEMENLTEELSSGQFTFASKFRQEAHGSLTLIELSLVPIAMLSTVDFRLINQEGTKKIFGVPSLFVDWTINHTEERVSMENLRVELHQLDTALVRLLKPHFSSDPNQLLDSMEKLSQHLKNSIVRTIIALAPVAVSRMVIEEDILEGCNRLTPRSIRFDPNQIFNQEEDEPND